MNAFASRKAALAAAVTVVSLATAAQAATYTWTPTAAATDKWSTGTNWSPTGPQSAVDTTLTFNDNGIAGAVGTDNDLTTDFQTNVINLEGTSNSAAASTVNFSTDKPIQLVANNGVNPVVNLDATNGTKGLTWNVYDHLDLANTTTFTGSGTASFQFKAGSLASTGGIVKDGSGIMRVQGTQSFSGGTTLKAGVLELSYTAILGSGNITFDTGNTAELRIGQSGGTVVSIANAIVLNGNANISNYYTDAARTLTISGGITGTADLTFNGQSDSKTAYTTVTTNPINIGTHTVNIAHGDILEIDTTNNTWGTMENFSGTTKLGADNALPTSSTFNFNGQYSPAKILDLNGHGQTLAKVARNAGTTGAATITNSGTGTATLTINNAGADDLTTITVQDGTAPVALVKNGAGVLTIGSANTYSGGTTVNQGTLVLSNTSGSATGTGAITVADGATLSGPGAAGGLVSLASGAVLAPGSSAGTISLTNGLTLGDGSALNLDLGTTGADKVLVTGGTLTGATAPGSVTVNVADAGGLAPNQSYTLIDFTGATASGLDASDFSLVTAAPIKGDFSVVGNTLVLNTTAVPEPTAGLLFAAPALVAFARRRNRRGATIA